MIQNKQEFIEALLGVHWGQKIVKINNRLYTPYEALCYCEAFNVKLIDVIEYIQLKDIANISDEDLDHFGFTNIDDFSEYVYQELELGAYEQDYFRSKGYGQPFRGKCIEEMINQGIPIKLV